jgi:hypothetical protein
MTSDGYQAEFDTLTPKGYFPTCVQGGGSGASTRYAALFVKQETPIPQQFNATGATANADIDNVIRLAMKGSPVWNASLAIVHGKRLVYARGYSWGEPDWPVCQPTSRFRIASVSKTVTALAVYQLIGEGKLKLTDKVQDILQLKTPAGGAPKDSRFKDVTVRHLLEHTSGISANAFRNEVKILDAHKAAVPNGNWHLPVTAEMCDSYVASLDMGAKDPGQAMAYNNCGYYLLGRIVAKKRGKTRPIDTFQDHLFDPCTSTNLRQKWIPDESVKARQVSSLPYLLPQPLLCQPPSRRAAGARGSAAVLPASSPRRTPTTPTCDAKITGTWSRPEGDHHQRPIAAASAAARPDPAATFHCLRRTWAGHRMMAGAPLTVEAQVLERPAQRLGLPRPAVLGHPGPPESDPRTLASRTPGTNCLPAVKGKPIIAVG